MFLGYSPDPCWDRLRTVISTNWHTPPTPSRHRGVTMKSSLITALSLVGVIGAGSAAALVNTSIFDSAPQSEQAAFVPGAAVVELTLPATPDPAPVANANGMSLEQLTGGPQETPAAQTDAVAVSQATTIPSTTTGAATSAGVSSAGSLSLKQVTTTVAPTPTTTAPPANTPSLLTRYDVGEAGSVTVDVIDGKIALIDATVGAGWTLVSSGTSTGSNAVNVQFTDDQINVYFTATLANETITPSIRSEKVPTSGGYYDDDDDDHYEHDDDEHDDDDHDDDGHYEDHDDD